jgi:hypothetical protein
LESLQIATETDANDFSSFETLADGNQSHGNHLKPLRIASKVDPQKINNLETLAHSNHMHFFRIEPLHIATNTNDIAGNLCP